MGNGEKALVYLGRYLYRGVIQERDILRCADGQVTFRYRDSESGKNTTRTVSGAHFLWLVLQHVLPKGFRRSRNFGLLHRNCRHRQRLALLMRQPCTEQPAPIHTARQHAHGCGGGVRLRYRDLYPTTRAMRVEAATKAARVRQCDLPGRQCRANSWEMFSEAATGHGDRARPTAGSDRGFARSNLFR